MRLLSKQKKMNHYIALGVASSSISDCIYLKITVSISMCIQDVRDSAKLLSHNYILFIICTNGLFFMNNKKKNLLPNANDEAIEARA